MGIRVSAAELNSWVRDGLIAPSVAIVKPKRKPQTAVSSARHYWSITLRVPCRVCSDANRKDHWSVKRRRTEVQEQALEAAFRNADLNAWPIPLPCVVTWVRVGKQKLDDDNLSNAFKACRDWLAKFIGVDDGDASVTWKCEQRVGSEPCVELRIESGGA